MPNKQITRNCFPRVNKLLGIKEPGNVSEGGAINVHSFQRRRGKVIPSRQDNVLAHFACLMDLHMSQLVLHFATTQREENN